MGLMQSLRTSASAAASVGKAPIWLPDSMSQRS